MQRIAQIYKKNPSKPVFSFEFFPPKDSTGEKVLFETIADLEKLRPDYVSVTYGAGGSTRDKTLRWVHDIQDRFEITSMAHFTCIGHGRDAIGRELDTFARAGIQNIMALRGDKPADNPDYQPPADGFDHASELIAFIKDRNPEFSIGAACYPEVHQEAVSAEFDLKNLKHKVDSGADFLITQLFFVNDLYYSFVQQCRKAGIQVPVVPGIMPITNLKQIDRFTQMAGCHIPEELVFALRAAGEDRAELLRISLEFSHRQCADLLAQGAPGIHFYTLNRSTATRQIMQRLGAGV